MAMGIIKVLKIYFVFTIAVMMLYAIRHAIFSYNRMFGRQRIYYNDVYDSELPFISVLIPMHNEEKVLHYVLDSLLECDYDREKIEIIPINDNSTDSTPELLDEYHEKYPFIRPLHRDSDVRGKPAGLNDAMEIAKGEVVIIFDADYRPSKKMLSRLAIAFSNPEVGAVMGRVVPYNPDTNLLTKLLNIERSGGYQVDQQARYNLKLMPQYGGTVGGFRKKLVQETGGFDTRVLAEDTELTYRLFTRGYKVIYANDAECYEESPETWKVRGRQVRRWSRGHNTAMIRYFFPVLFSKHMSIREKVDGIFLLFIYMIPFILLLAIIDSVILFFLGEMNIFVSWWALLFVTAYNSYGNFAPFYEIATALMIDGRRNDLLMLPLMTFSFYFYLWNISLGFIDAIIDLLTFRTVSWAKTERFTEKKGTEVNLDNNSTSEQQPVSLLKEKEMVSQKSNVINYVNKNKKVVFNSAIFYSLLLVLIVSTALFTYWLNKNRIILDKSTTPTISDEMKDIPRFNENSLIVIDENDNDLIIIDENVVEDNENNKKYNKDHTVKEEIKEKPENSDSHEIEENAKVDGNEDFDQKNKGYYKYKLKSGMTLYSISTMLYGDNKMVSRLKKVNNITDVTNVSVGKTLLLPKTYSDKYKTSTPRIYKIKKGDTLFSISMKYYGNKNMIESIRDFNGIGNIKNISVGSTIFIPIK